MDSQAKPGYADAAMTCANPVVLLHGLARTQRMMAGLRRALERGGRTTWACTYPSTQRPLAELADWVEAKVRADLGERPLDVVTHSMGGIVWRHLGHLSWGRAVLIAPPNDASALADRLRLHPAFGPVFRRLYGPAGIEVSTGGDWPLPASEFAVIAGTRSVSLTNPTSLLAAGLGVFDGPSDGTVAVAETRLEGASDFATVDATHTWICGRADVARMTQNFLETGALRG